MTVSVSTLLAGLGGAKNIVGAEAHISRIRVKVADSERTNEQVIRDSGALAVVFQKDAIDVIVGPEAGELAIQLSGA